MTDAKPSFKAKLALVDENYQTPADFEKRPVAEQKEIRETALIANGIKEGMRRTNLKLSQMGERAIEEISLLAQVRLEHAAHMQANEGRWEREERKHGRHRFWQGIAVGGILVGLGLSAFQLYTFAAISDTIAQTTRQDVMTGAIVRAHSEGER